MEEFVRRIAAIDVPLFTMAGDRIGTLELVGFLTGAGCVWLATRRRVLNFPIGIANSVCFLLVFALAGIWANAALQVLFIILGLEGWWRWTRTEEHQPAATPRRASRQALAACMLFVATSTWLLMAPLHAAGDPAPLWDALTTSLSLAAQWLLNRRRIETWLFWIAADCIYVPLLVDQGLILTAAVYCLLLGMCIAGWHDWRRAARTLKPLAAESASP